MLFSLSPNYMAVDALLPHSPVGAHAATAKSSYTLLSTKKYSDAVTIDASANGGGLRADFALKTASP